MLQDRETYIFSTGRQIVANCGILGLKPKGRPLTEPWETRLCEGYDSHLEAGSLPTASDDPTPGLPLSAAERRELADHMIREWDEWARELE